MVGGKLAIRPSVELRHEMIAPEQDSLGLAVESTPGQGAVFRVLIPIPDHPG